MKYFQKADFPVTQVRKYLEPGPIVLVSARWKDQTNIMTMGWHSVIEFSPSLVGCVISEANHSYEMIRKSKECVINIPTVEMIDKIIGIGTTAGLAIDKFKKFDLTAQEVEKVNAPMIRECYANFECRVSDTSLLRKYNFFILEVVKAHVARSPKLPTTVHYRGDGLFMVSGKYLSYPGKLKG
jgi:flavin reductase (DIM6/NTAB) family NADH-FMN oxidoreductase RutF